MNVNLKGLSVAIIAKNAEKVIANCLQSVAGISNEIIVVINDCTDDTKNIAELYGARVIEHEWEGYRDQKNFVISHAKHEWILSLDADEALTDVLKSAIKNFISQDFQTFTGAKFARKTFFLGQCMSYGDWLSHDNEVRLFKNGHGQFVGGSVHEYLKVDGEIKYLKGDILHHSCEDLEEFIKRNILYAELGANDLFKKYSDTFSGRWKSSIIHAVIRSVWKFFRGYVLKFGFLDGANGYCLAKIQSFVTFYKYFRFRDLMSRKT